MSLNKSLGIYMLILFVVFGWCLSSCKRIEPTSNETPKNVPVAEVEMAIIEGANVQRIYDAKYGIVCYKYSAQGVSCVKL